MNDNDKPLYELLNPKIEEVDSFLEKIASVKKETLSSGDKESIDYMEKMLLILKGLMNQEIPESYPLIKEFFRGYNVLDFTYVIMNLSFSLDANTDNFYGEPTKLFDLLGKDMMERLKYHYTRQEYVFVSSWALVSYDWVRELANNIIKDSKCLEIMGGSGMLTKALQDCGVDCICTDNLSWAERNVNYNNWAEVEVLDAVSAIQKYGTEVDFIICSWAPYTEIDIYDALLEMRKVNPNCIMISIGEGPGGCTGCDEFYDEIEELEVPELDKVNALFPQWYGMHDRIIMVK